MSANGNGSDSKSNAYYQSRVPDLYAATITLAVLQTLTVIARFAARRISAANIWWDDYTIVLALVRYYPVHNFRAQAPVGLQSALDPGLWAVRLLLGPDPNLQFWASHSGIWRSCHP